MWTRDAKITSASLTTTGGVTWPAARRLAEYFEATGLLTTNFKPPSTDNQERNGSNSSSSGQTLEGPSILELGSGCGWLGLTLARNLRGSRIYLSEQEEGDGLSWLKQNVGDNMDLEGVEQVKCVPCDWRLFDSRSKVSKEEGRGGKEEGSGGKEEGSGGKEEGSGGKEGSCTGLESKEGGDGGKEEVTESSNDVLLSTEWDFIIGSDLIYTEEGVKLLPRVLKGLLKSSRQAVCYYCHTLLRFENLDILFFKELEAVGLEVEEVWEEGKEPPPPPPPMLTELYPDMRIAIFRITMKQP